MAYDSPGLNTNNLFFRTTAQQIANSGKPSSIAGASSATSVQVRNTPSLLSTKTTSSQLSNYELAMLMPVSAGVGSRTVATLPSYAQGKIPVTTLTAGAGNISSQSVQQIIDSMPIGKAIGYTNNAQGNPVFTPTTQQGINALVGAYAAGKSGIAQQYAAETQGVLAGEQAALLSQANASGISGSNGSANSNDMSWTTVAVIAVAAIAGIALIGKVLK